MSRFIFVDNDPSTVRDDLIEALGADNVAVALYPGDFSGSQASQTKQLLDSASVVLMDLELYEGAVPEFSLEPGNGIALEETIRSWLADKGQVPAHSPRAYVLFSHELGKIAGSLGLAGREHVIARQTGNEWVMSKNERDRPAHHKNLSSLNTIASAVEFLPDNWPNEGSSLRQEVLRILGIGTPDELPWHELAAEDSERAGLPLQSIGEGQHERLLRWILHVAMPFPSCLLDLNEIAVQLRISPSHIAQDNALAERLKASLAEYAYTGPAAGFIGPRWWRAGVGTLRDQLADEARRTGQEPYAYALDFFGVPADGAIPPDTPHPVSTVNERFVRDDGYADISLCVRVLTDDWPDELERPRMRIDLVQSSDRLVALVHPEDRYRLPEAVVGG